MGAPTSTYRLQVTPNFDLHAAAAVCDYLANLGVGAVYLSPLLPSVKGSEHGYDVVGFETIDAARGGIDGWTRLLAAAKSRGLKVIVDIVPNHTGVARPHENPAWWDLLRHGRGSKHAHWFDIDWSFGRVRLPVLGDEFDESHLDVTGAELRYGGLRFPLAPGTEPAHGESAADVHARQHYELVNYRRADTEQNYRRFFTITSLAGLRVEDVEVFEATHSQVGRWLRADGVDGLRIDHPDGLADPRDYLMRLRQICGPDAWITVEKILEPGEQLPAGWPVAGTTGYDALGEVAPLFVDPAAEPALDALYRELTGDQASYGEHVERGKRTAVTTVLRAEVDRLARLAPDVDHADEALTELLVAFPVYRSYLPAGAEHLALAVERAWTARRDLAAAIGALATRLSDPSDELCVRFQQTTGAVMAKGVEDTAYYRYTRFVALNEVGADPSELGVPPEAFHAAQLKRQLIAPRGMTTLSTHDTKRGEDVRARLAVLSEVPDDWGRTVRTLMAAAPVADRAFGYLLWQSFAGAGFIARERMHGYAEKAMREAAVFTSWTSPDTALEGAVHDVVDQAYDDPEVHEPLAALVEMLTPYGWSNSLSQKLVQLTMPGVPDVYQGTELWDDSLVDPDNRRRVDFGEREVLLDAMDGDVRTPPIDATGRAKQWLTARTLRMRRDWPDLFTTYAPVQVDGPAAEHAVAFDRGGVITVATRLPVGLARRGGWGETSLNLGGRVTDAIGGVSHQGRVPMSDLLSDYPAALLVR